MDFGIQDRTVQRRVCSNLLALKVKDQRQSKEHEDRDKISFSYFSFFIRVYLQGILVESKEEKSFYTCME